MRAHDPPDRDVRPRPAQPGRAAQPARPNAGRAALTDPTAAILTLQRRAGNAAVARAIQGSTAHQVLRAAGSPLPEPVRHDMEARLGADFSDVRLHTDALAQRSATELGARAYTSGHHIVAGAGGIDRHTLAHELTHVIQQRGGPVPGTDNGHGLSVSDPGDAFERAAEANATRALAAPRPEATPRPEAAPRPEAGAENRTASSGGAGPTAHTPVQRWAWIKDDLITPDDTSVVKNDDMRSRATEQLVHVYEDEKEFRDHAADRTDHIGNLPPGAPSADTWVRFPTTGTNVLGEQHDHVTLDHVLTAVGSRSFTYEGFAFDKIPSGSALKTAYKDANQSRFNDFGIAGEKKKSRFGAESLYPKMGYLMTEVLPSLKKQETAGLRQGSHTGQMGQRGVKMAWAYARDATESRSTLVSNVFKGVFPTKGELEAREKLAEAFKADERTLDGFITNLSTNGYLGTSLQALGAQERAAVFAALTRFSEAFIEAMFLQVSTDKNLDKNEHATLQGAREQNVTYRGIFLEARDMHFGHAARDAMKKGVRYIGMGSLHLEELIERGHVARDRAFDMTPDGKHLNEAEDLTRDRTAKAQAAGL
ncbi:eCIS core domain-containing protein [Plantactinospora sp. DSM 117369]